MRRAFAKAGSGTPPEIGERLGVSGEKVRQWQAAIEAREPIRLIARTRNDLEAYLSRDRPQESVDYWRGVLATHRQTLRAIVQTMDAQLAGQGASAPVAPAPMSGGVGDGADAGALLGTHTSRRRRSKEA